MSRQLSFSKIENKLLPSFRRQMGSAESTEDIKKFYTYTAQELLNLALADKAQISYEDISLLPEEIPHYRLNQDLLTNADFTTLWQGSDLRHVLGRLTDTAMNHYRHLAKNPGKTEAKIRN
ncbi:MAG: hypothetical protein ABFR97_10365 [Thermodesulfobacteriota bacterium]